MNKKQVLGAFILFFFLAASAYAKQKDQPEHLLTADQIVAKMKVQLGLSDEQLVEVKPIIEGHLAQEEQLKLEEKQQLSKVLTGQQLYTWNFLQNEGAPRQKKKQSLF